MKKIILFLVISVMCVSVYAQTAVEVETLKVTDLGDKEEAIRLLRFLYDLNSKGGTYIHLENRTNNVVSWNRLGYYTVFS